MKNLRILAASVFSSPKSITKRFVHLALTLTTSVLIALPAKAEIIPGGQFRVITYNVAGLPSWINNLDTDRFEPMGEKLSEFDIVLVQEDFWYHDLLAANMDFPYKSTPKVNSWGEWLWLYLVNDGLNRFSRFPMTEVKRHPWDRCHDYNVSGGNGSDCCA
ncbi:hypothetical protein [Endozoicomonas arenosclerae]|uniref:hypothetical protein n=1 Tax=Endozoicomonas arenosclerae TaxID=1633495 RepID=UPI0007835377|nr:hypothetical protein [Endozoicomonas arenosclerae]